MVAALMVGYAYVSMYVHSRHTCTQASGPTEAKIKDEYIIGPTKT